MKITITGDTAEEVKQVQVICQRVRDLVAARHEWLQVMVGMAEAQAKLGKERRPSPEERETMEDVREELKELNGGVELPLEVQLENVTRELEIVESLVEATLR